MDPPQVEMSEDHPNNGAELVPVEHGLALTSLADNKIVSEMVADSLVLARDSASAPVDLDALVREAKRLYLSKGDGMTEENIRAFKLFLRAAEAGHSEAQYYLGYCYDNGEGVPQDYLDGAKWYCNAAEQGHADAQANLGYCYIEGHGVPQDHVEAVKWYRKAADQGSAMGQNNLGCCYDNGQGVPQDYVEAVKWYRKAAKQGHAHAQNNLGRCYDNGRGVPQDYVEAVKWLRKAAEQGHANAQALLAVCYRNGQGVPQDYVEAVKWYRKASEQGDALAQASLAVCYRIGQGVPQDYVEAVKWYRKAAEQGVRPGTKQSWLLLSQRPCHKTMWKRLNGIAKLLNKGYALAQNNLGYCYRDGQGVPFDLLQAYKWFQLAGDQGDKEAKEEATALAALMPLSEFKSAYKLYREFKDQHTAKE